MKNEEPLIKQQAKVNLVFENVGIVYHFNNILIWRNSFIHRNDNNISELIWLTEWEKNNVL